MIDQRLSQRPVVMLVHFGVLEKLARLYSRKKIIFGKKAVVFAIDLARAWRAGGAGNGIDEIGGLGKGVGPRRLTRAWWRRGGKQNSVARKFVTQGFAPVREFSPARSCTPLLAARSRRHSPL